MRQLFQDIGPTLNLAANPPIGNYSPVVVKQHLITNHLKFCFLVVDAETVKHAYENPSHQKDEYADLLKTAANEVGKIGFNP